jgi:Predicted transcriptional regulator with C-terminal CBS domains
MSNYLLKKGEFNVLMIPKTEEIKRRRMNLGLSKHRLSLISGLSGTAILRIENKKTIKTHPLRAKAIADALGCKVEDVFEKENDNE